MAISHKISDIVRFAEQRAPPGFIVIQNPCTDSVTIQYGDHRVAIDIWGIMHARPGTEGTYIVERELMGAFSKLKEMQREKDANEYKAAMRGRAIPPELITKKPLPEPNEKPKNDEARRKQIILLTRSLK